MTSTSHLLPCWEHQRFIHILQNYKILQSSPKLSKTYKTKKLSKATKANKWRRKISYLYKKMRIRLINESPWISLYTCRVLIKIGNDKTHILMIPWSSPLKFEFGLRVPHKGLLEASFWPTMSTISTHLLGISICTYFIIFNHKFT